jgi:hypothetical protein
MTAGAGVCDKREVWVKRFADACYKGKGGIACCKNKGVITCCRGREDMRRLKRVVASLVKVRLRRF